MAAKDIEAGRAFVSLRLQDLMSQGLDRVERRMMSFGKGVGLAGAGLMGMGGGAAAAIGGIGAAVFGAAKSFADTGSQLADMSARTGIAASSLSALGYAAGMTGADLQSIENASRTMQKTIGEAAYGGQAASESLKHLGISAKDLKGMNVEQQFATIGDAISKIEDPTMRNAAAMGVFGKSATSIMPMLTGGLSDMISEAQELGLVMSNEDVAAADALGDAMDKITLVFKAVINTVGAAVAGPLTDIIGKVVSIVGVANRWVQANRGLVRGLVYILGIGGAVAAAVAALGAVLVGVGGAISLAGMALGAIPAVFSAIAAVIGAVFSPMGALVAILLGLVGAAIYFRSALYEAFQGVLVWIQPVIDAFWRIMEVAMTAFQGIVDALSNGNLQAAADIAIAGLIAVFWKAASEIPGIGKILSSGFGQAILAGRWDLIVGIAMTKAKLWVSDTAAGIGAIWDMLVYGIRTGWHSASTFLASAFLKAVAAINYSFVGLQVMFDALVTGAKIAANAVHGFFTGSSDQAAEQNKKLAAELAARTGKRSEDARTYDTGLQNTLAEDAARTQAQIRKDFEKSFMGRATQGQELRDQLASLEGQARTAAADAGVTTAEDAAIKAKADLEKAIETAKSGGATASVREAAKASMEPVFGGSQVLPKVESRGTFSAAAAVAFGGGTNAMDRVADNTLYTRRYLKEIKDKPGAAFS